MNFKLYFVFLSVFVCVVLVLIFSFIKLSFVVDSEFPEEFDNSLLNRSPQSGSIFNATQKFENSVLIANYVTAVDNHLRKTALKYTDSSFVDPYAKTETASDNQLPSGPKMHSILEIAQVTRPESIAVTRPCNGNHGKGLFAVVFVFCVAGDTNRRAVIRETYGSALKESPLTEIYFVVGRVYDQVIEDKLRQEAKLFDDIIQFDFKDDYYNLTLKSIAMLRWASLHCSDAKLIYKMDNDAFIRVKPFLRKMKSFSRNALYGLLHKKSPVMREGKWAIDKLYYPHEYYPQHLSGIYLIPAKAAFKLYAAILQEPTNDSVPALPFEDVYVTGILAKKVDLPRVAFPSFAILYEHNSFGHQNDKDNFKLLQSLIVFCETLKDDDFRKIWQHFGAN